jgi:hypothetical protein
VALVKSFNRAEATKTRRGSIGQQDGSDRLEIDDQRGALSTHWQRSSNGNTDIGLNEMQSLASAPQV